MATDRHLRDVGEAQAREERLTFHPMATRGVTRELLEELEFVEYVRNLVAPVSRLDLKISRAVRRFRSVEGAAEAIRPGKPSFHSYVSRRLKRMRAVARRLLSPHPGLPLPLDRPRRDSEPPCKVRSLDYEVQRPL